MSGITNRIHSIVFVDFNYEGFTNKLMWWNYNCGQFGHPSIIFYSYKFQVTLKNQAAHRSREIDMTSLAHSLWKNRPLQTQKLVFGLNWTVLHNITSFTSLLASTLRSTLTTSALAFKQCGQCSNNIWMKPQICSVGLLWWGNFQVYYIFPDLDIVLQIILNDIKCAFSSTLFSPLIIWYSFNHLP